MADRVRVEIRDRVARLTLADSARRNALDVPFAGEIAAAFDDLEQRDDVGALVGAGMNLALACDARVASVSTRSRASISSRRGRNGGEDR